MPVYEYQCPKCKKIVELFFLSLKEIQEPLCCSEDCSDIRMVRIISASSFSLKGTGWYKDGYSSPKK